MGERIFLEDWIRGNTSKLFREEKGDPGDEKHSHVTFFQPGEIRDNHENIFIESVIKFCAGRHPIKYIVKGAGNFGQQTYAPVFNNELLEFNYGLEAAVQPHVIFDKKLAREKVLHVSYDTHVQYFEEMELVMLRLTCIKGSGRGKRIWFSFDFVTQELLDRRQSLDESRWQNTNAIYFAQ